eukprot:3036946-Alexandrium_andersonii.AAC.1
MAGHWCRGETLLLALARCTTSTRGTSWTSNRWALVKRRIVDVSPRALHYFDSRYLLEFGGHCVCWMPNAILLPRKAALGWRSGDAGHGTTGPSLE